MNTAPAIVWFRRDLRIGDHRPLLSALEEHDQVVPLFVRDERLLDGPASSQRRSDRLEAAIASLDRDLRDLGGRLVVRTGDPERIVPTVAAEAGAEQVLAHREHTPFGRTRDRRIGDVVELRLKRGVLASEPEDIGDLKVFSAFHRRWQRLDLGGPLPAPPRLMVPESIQGEALRAQPDPDVGEQAALRRARAFAEARARDYVRDRGRLDLDASSRLSADLHLGTLSVRQLLDLVDVEAFRRQLAWRDWAGHLLWWRPEALRLGWREDLRDMAWLRDEAAFAAWREGRTGFPVVDAGMRQLATEGWIDNRARLIVASFLAKDLLLDWRLGERYFLQQLIDGDIANNSLGWQWTAGVGTDAAPFFRILSPIRQGERFDPQGRWVRRWVPELRSVDGAAIHRPWVDGGPNGYPPPIVDHAAAARRALDTFRAAGEERIRTSR